MKKLFIGILALALSLSAVCGCTPISAPSDSDDGSTIQKPSEDNTELCKSLSVGGFATDKIGDFSAYENTPEYRKVTTADEFFTAIVDAKYHYKNVWDEATSTYTQVPADGYTEENFKGKVKVIEIANDLNLGYNKLSSTAKASGIVDDFAKKLSQLSPYLYVSDMLEKNGISQIKVEGISDLLIYSKNGAKLTHCGFKLTSDNNVVFRNLRFDEMWQWEDGNKTASKIGDYDWFGWAYFKIAFCGYVWIDHCSFGKSYDGQIDYSNPDYTANAGVAFRAPYGADGGNGLHISYCNFDAGSDDKDGYVYKMMQNIEDDYQAHKDGADTSYVSQHAYYDALRNKGISFEDIFYALAIPQKKGFLCGDSGNNTTDYEYNLKLKISFANCKFVDLEDRLPKLRGGNAYMYNCVVDSSRYYGYRTKIKPVAASAVTAVNSSWKCALVSQGIVCGNGGSVKAENCIYRGIDRLLKNNDSNPAPKVYGGYMLVNCSYQGAASSPAYVGSSNETDHKFTNDTTLLLKTDYFEWHTADNAQPFTISPVALDKLETALAEKDFGSGAKSEFKLSLLKSNYLEQ